MPRLVLYPFKFRDRITGKWVRARHVTPGSAEPFSPFRPTASVRAIIAPMLLWTR